MCLFTCNVIVSRVIIHTLFLLCSLAVKQAREAALDAQLLVVATDLGKEKATQLFSEGTAFNLSAFAEHLVSEFIVILCTCNIHYNCMQH